MPTASTAPNAPVAVSVALAALGLLLILIGVVYFAEPARALPVFFPGHQTGSTHHHSKHGIAAMLLALLSFAGAWFSTGERTLRPLGHGETL